MGRQSSLEAGKAEVAKLDFTQAEVDFLKRKLLALCDAKVIVRSTERDKDGKIKYIEVDNCGIQLPAIVKALEFGVGKPKQMVEVRAPGQALPAPGMRELASLAAKDPAVLATILQALKDGVALTQAIDITSTSDEKPDSPVESESGGSPS